MRKSILTYIFLLFGLFGTVSGQNLEIVLDSTFTNLKIGQTFAVTGRIQNSGADIPSGQTIKATVEFVGPDGIAVATHVQTWNGFPETNNPGTLRNDNTNSRVLFQFPWSQAGKAVSGWSIRAFVEGAALETDLSDNSAIHDGFTMDLPDLIVASSSLSTDNATNTYLPNSVITVSGIVRNIGLARTQENVLFPLVAQLYRGATATPANLVETETLIIPSPDAGGFPYIEENDDLSFTINNIHLPADASPGDAFTLTVTVDPSDLAFGDIIHEVSENGEQQTSINSFEISNEAVNRAQLTVDPDSFDGDVGSFRGLDPIRISFSVKNNGQSAVQSSENFAVQVALSKNLTFDESDFVLREFDLSGNALGSNLLPNESITLDWIQQLPDNFEGDFYYLVDIQGTNPQTFFLDNTPSISLISSFKGTTNLVEGLANTNTPGGERPSSSKDGRIVAYEKEINGIQHIYYTDILGDGDPVLVTKHYIFDGVVGNGSSYKPKVSADGSTIVFHSSASNLVPGDFNNQMDVFMFRLSNSKIVRAYNSNLDSESDGPSFNPCVNENGSVIVFESAASNLQSSGQETQGHQIFAWKTQEIESNSIHAITAGNAPSKSPAIDYSGNAIVFSSDATDIPAVSFGINTKDENDFTDVFLHYLDTNLTYLVNLNKFNEQATLGASDQPAISGDGSMIAYRSRATNLVSEKAISLVTVNNGGVGYTGNPSLIVADLNGTGSGASLEFQLDGIDVFGQISPDSIRILNNGENYTSPIVSVIPDPNQPSPTEVADITAHLSHPEGEIYKISTSDIIGTSVSNQRVYSVRISENPNKVGGDMESREPSISGDGSMIVYSTKSSNLLDQNVSRESGEVFYNTPINAADARAILSGGIGEIEVLNPGSGYQNGFLFINDTSGNGSGAVASYQVDSLGRIASITMVNAGSGYDLETTFISVDSPRGGSGFVATANRYDQGGRIQRIEMVDNGSGYQNIASTNQGKSGMITLDGDGSDSNADGKPDAKINSERVFVDFNGTGGIYIEQIINVELLSTNSLLNTTLIFTDYQQAVSLNFAQASTSFNTIGIFGKTLSEVCEEIISKLNDLWNNPSSTDRFQGPKISGFSVGGTSFIFAALGGRVESNNPTSTNIKYESNMLIGGSGFTRATPTIAPAPVIHGFSEVVSGTNILDASNGRSLYLPIMDKDTDDIYLYSANSGSNERVSKSSFGLPINYLPTSSVTMPSNRFPFMSGDGRHIFFSSDASGEGGLVFTGTNQSADDTNNVRDVYHHDRKTASILSDNIAVNLVYPNNNITHSYAPSSQIPIIIDLNYSQNDINIVILRDDIPTGLLGQVNSSYETQRWTGTFNAGSPGSHVVRTVVFNENFEEIGSSAPVQYTVSPLQGAIPIISFEQPLFDVLTTTSVLSVSAGANDSDGTIVGVQFYIDGAKFGDLIPRTPGLTQTSQVYSTGLTFTQPGVKSIIAVAHDNGGNYVASEAHTLSIAPGSTPAVIQFGKSVSDLTLADDLLDFNISSNGSILGVNLQQPVGDNFVGLPRVDVLGNGTNAEVTAVVNQSVGSQHYGKVTGFLINNAGSGYDKNNTTFNVVPVNRLIGNGTPAEIVIGLQTDFNQTTQQNDFVTNTVALRENVDGTPRGGSGYVLSPRLRLDGRVVGFGGQSYERLPLADPVGTTSQVAVFQIGPTNTRYNESVLLGGFSHAPIFFDFEVFQTIEQIDEVVLLVDGESIESKGSPPYSFEWIPSLDKDYSISAVVKDAVGNVSSTQSKTISVTRFKGSGVNAAFNVPIPESANVGSDLLLSVEAFSEVGVAEVEFFMDGVSVGKVLDQNSTVFSKVLNLTGYDQGLHHVSFIARDYNGNQAGVFDASLTNILDRQRQPINLDPAANIGVPEISMNYPSNNITISSTSTIRLSCLATDPDDSLLGVQYFLNGEHYGEIIPYDKSEPSDHHAFGINWSPNGQTGTFYFSASAVDVSDNVSFTPPVAIQVSQGNVNVPVVSLGSLSASYDVGDVISLTASVLDSAASSSGYGVVEKVTFFVNGIQQGDEDTQFPYVTNWTPQDSGTYEVHVLAQDNEGNYGISEISEVKILDLERVNLYMAPVEQINDGTSIGLIDGSLHTINVSANGDPEALEGLNELTLYANGKVVGGSTGTQLILGTGLIDRVAYSFEWLVDYDRYADANGGVQLVATGGNPLISSNIESVRILSPVPWSNPVSAASSILKDLTGVGASESDIQEFQLLIDSSESDPNSVLLNWLATVNASTVEQRIDIVAAHHIAIGKFHSSLSSILEAETFITANNDQWLKSYIDELLLSDEYQARFGQVPFMVGSLSQSNSINFFQNRLDFVTDCFNNKYGYFPSFSQSYQGSNRMLTYWENFQPDYWELQIGTLDDLTVDSPPRRDDLGTFESGHLAVDLIFHLARETSFEGGFPYIAGSPSYRENVYKIVMYAFFLMQENSSELTEADLTNFTSLPFEQAFEEIINDYRYTSRFNFIWNNSTEVGPNWKQEPWFGVFMDKYFPWIYHINLGWVYISGGTQEYDKELNVGGFWAFSEKLGWFWTYNEVYPWIYLDNEWVYLNMNSNSTMSDLYFSTAQNSWIKF